MVTYRRKGWERDGSHFLVDVETFEEEDCLFVTLTPHQDVVLNVGHPGGQDNLLPMGKEPWSLDLETFTERYEPVSKGKPLKLG